MSQEELQNITEHLEELREDTSLSKNIREKIGSMIKILEEETELSLKVNKALSALEEIADDNMIPTYTRTQLWNIASLLESINA
ncbi:hypothetical protein GOV05_04210 [Candidatus Woesearchaeota archaeon]|nr:hypothetical protein [Candidatus Woesearchaeota archaeon]